MTLAVNVSAHAQASTANSLSVTLTSVPAGDLIVVVVNAETIASALTVNSVTATGLTFTQRAVKADSGFGGGFSVQRTDIWWAAAPAGFTGSITAHFNTNIDDATIHAFSVTGADTTTPFAGTTANNSHTSGTAAVDTNGTFTAAAGTMAIVAAGSAGGSTITTPSSGFTNISTESNSGGSNNENSAVAYQVLSSLLSGATVGWPAARTTWTLLADSISPAPPVTLDVEFDLPLEWRSTFLGSTTSQPDSGTDDTISNVDGFRFPLQWSAVADVVGDPVGVWSETRPAIVRASITMPAPSLTGGLPTNWDIATVEAATDYSEWGYLHLMIAGKSRTKDRGLHFVPLQDSQDEPFGDSDASFRLPGITEFDDPADFGIRALAPVRLWRRDMAGNDHTLYEGSIASLQPDGRFDDLGAPGLVVQCVGALYRLDLLKSRPRLLLNELDLGYIISHTINTQRDAHALNLGHMHQKNTGITGVHDADFSNLITGAIQNYLSQMTDDNGDQWTIHLARPRTPRLELKDTTTVDATITYGTPGINCQLSKDYTAATTAVFATGTSGHSAWMGAQFPNLSQGDTPDFPLGMGGTFVPGDGQTGFAPFAAFLRRGAYGGIASDDTYLAADEDNVKAFQDDAGVTIDGQVGAQTWTAAFAAGANQGTIRGAYVGAIYAHPGTRKHKFNAQGARTGHNPNFDPTVPRIDDYIPFGDHVPKHLGRKSAKQLVNRRYPAGRAGTIVLSIDPEEMSRFAVQAGMNVKIKHYNGTDVLVHVNRRERDWQAMTVTLTVDEKGDDRLTAAAIHQRKRDTSDLAKRRTFGKRRSRVYNDAGPWLSEDGAGQVGLMYQQAGRWNTVRVPAAPSGTVQEVRFAGGTGLTEHLLHRSLTDDKPDPIPGAARFAVLITGQPIHPRAITRLPGMGTPLTELGDGSNPWDKNKSVLNRHFQMIYAAGGPGAALGFSPHTDPGDGSDTDLTGLYVDGGGFTYGPTEHFWVWVSVWSPVDCKIGGRLFPGAPA